MPFYTNVMHWNSYEAFVFSIHASDKHLGMILMIDIQINSFLEIWSKVKILANQACQL